MLKSSRVYTLDYCVWYHTVAVLRVYMAHIKAYVTICSIHSIFHSSFYNLCIIQQYITLIV